MTTKLVAALFVEKRSVYKDFSFIDAYDIDRDARSYRGALPVIAHPPCQLWGNLAHVNYKRWGGEHNRPGNDGGLFAFALETVNTFGGVLAHPKGTGAWPVFGLTKPYRNTWARSEKGWVCEVWQSAYGHRANKATWLYYVSLSEPHVRPPDFDWSRPTAEYQIGRQDSRGKDRNKPTLLPSEVNATPRLLALALIHLVCPVSPLRSPTTHDSLSLYG